MYSHGYLSVVITPLKYRDVLRAHKIATKPVPQPQPQNAAHTVGEQSMAVLELKVSDTKLNSNPF
jgi:hypothetical protein